MISFATSHEIPGTYKRYRTDLNPVAESASRTDIPGKA